MFSMVSGIQTSRRHPEYSKAINSYTPENGGFIRLTRSLAYAGFRLLRCPQFTRHGKIRLVWKSGPPGVTLKFGKVRLCLQPAAPRGCSLSEAVSSDGPDPSQYQGTASSIGKRSAQLIPTLRITSATRTPSTAGSVALTRSAAAQCCNVRSRSGRVDIE
jgi:hypothetical protein